MKSLTKYTSLFIALLLMLWGTACSDPKVPTFDPNPPAGGGDQQTYPVGVSAVPQHPKPDESVTIYFRADASSPLYNYKGDVYLHLGVVDGDTWLYVPAKWEENLSKCKMTPKADNVWMLTLGPTIRKWFSVSDTQPIPRIGVVVRNEQANAKGVQHDVFIPVADPLLTQGSVQNEPLPEGKELGINIEGDNRVTLVLYDRDNTGKHYDSAYVMGSFNNWSRSAQSLMKRDEAKGVWWLTLDNVSTATPQAFQYYLVGYDKTVRIADPFAPMVLMPDDKYIPASTYPGLTTYPEQGMGEPVSLLTATNDDYVWKHSQSFVSPAADELIIYELLIRDFSDKGNVRGVIENLDYIQSLGVNAIELMPIQEFDGNNSWGYNPCFYFAMDKAYGTANDYKELIDLCHQRGIAVILDVVYNHATGLNPMAKLYWDSSANRPMASNPWFNTEAPHPYSVFVDFNHESTLTQAFVKRNLRYLMQTLKIDGFRFDLSKGFTQQHSTEATAANYDASRVKILDGYRQAIQAVNPKAYVIMEHFAEPKEEREMSDKGMMMWRNMNHPFAQAAMGYSQGSSFLGLDAMLNGMPQNSAWVGYMESHDEERVAYKQQAFGVQVVKNDRQLATDRLMLDAAFLLLSRGPKMVWQFGELGYDIGIETGGRTGQKPSYLNRKTEPQRQRLYQMYQTLINFRKSHQALYHTTPPLDAYLWQVSDENWQRLRVMCMQQGSTKILLVGNFDTQNEQVYNFEDNAVWCDVLEANKPYTTSVKISPNSFRLFKTCP